MPDTNSTPHTASTHTPDVNARWIPLARVRGHSMEPALRSGSVVVTRPRGRRVISRGTLVLIARNNGVRVIKRIVGVPGDLIELEAGHVRINGHLLGDQTRVDGPVIATWCVPQGSYFVMGDNYNESDDSRVWEQPFVRHRQIAGVALRTVPTS